MDIPSHPENWVRTGKQFWCDLFQERTHLPVVVIPRLFQTHQVSNFVPTRADAIVVSSPGTKCI